MDNELIFEGGQYFYNVEKHGSSASSRGLCFNCKKKLKIQGFEEQKEQKQINLKDMKKSELLGFAAEKGILIPAGAKVDQIRAILAAKGL